MNLVTAACPSCGAQIKIPHDRDRAFCSYCGSQIMVEAAIAYGKVKIDGIVQTQSADFIVEAGVLKEYHGASTDVVVPDGVISIGRGVFRNMLVSSVTLPEGLQVIEREAFMGCKSLERITIPKSVREINDSCFSYCGSLSKIVLGDGVTSMGRYCFHNCTSLEEVVVGEGIAFIGDSSFRGCSALKAIVIPLSVAGLGEFAFGDCRNLSAVTFLNPEVNVDPLAFYGCSSLTSVNTSGGALRNIQHGAFSGTPWMIARTKEERRSQGVCEYCGGEFKGLITKRCSKCSREKNY